MDAWKLPLLSRVLCVEAREHRPQCEISNLPNASFAAGLFLHNFILVRGACQPTKVRRQPLWSIETEIKGKAMIMMVVMMMHMLMLRKYCCYPGFACRSTTMMMMMACILMMFLGMVAKLTSSTPPLSNPTPQTREALNHQTPWSLRHALA